jgi:hypothetical protein
LAVWGDDDFPDEAGVQVQSDPIAVLENVIDRGEDGLLGL